MDSRNAARAEIPPDAKYKVCIRVAELREFLKNVFVYRCVIANLAKKKADMAAAVFHSPE